MQINILKNDERITTIIERKPGKEVGPETLFIKQIVGTESTCDRQEGLLEVCQLFKRSKDIKKKIKINIFAFIFFDIKRLSEAPPKRYSLDFH